MPSAAWPNEQLSPEKRLSLFALILPFIEASDLHSKLKKDLGWDDPDHRQVFEMGLRIRHCPSKQDRPGSLHACFADGSVKCLLLTISPRVFRALCTIAGGEGDDHTLD